jgi:hypothetical protein
MRLQFGGKRGAQCDGRRVRCFAGLWAVCHPARLLFVRSVRVGRSAFLVAVWFVMFGVMATLLVLRPDISASRLGFAIRIEIQERPSLSLLLGREHPFRASLERCQFGIQPRGAAL